MKAIMDYKLGGLVANGGVLGSRDHVGLEKGNLQMSRKKNSVSGANFGMLMSGGGNYDMDARTMYERGGFMWRMGKPNNNNGMMKRRSKRLNVEEVRALERAFKESNKLGLERKGRLARELNLQARQIAVWFQNRRARCKSKQIESDYDGLKREMQALRAQRDQLLQDKEKLQDQVSTLKHELKLRENVGEGGDSAMSSPTTIPQESEQLEYSPAVSIIEDNNIHQQLLWNLPITWNTNSTTFTNVTTTSSNITSADPIILDEEFLFYHQNNLIYAS